MRDGFSLWAFLFGWLWMLRHRMWLVLLGYLLVTIGLETALWMLNASSAAIALVGILISLLVGFEAATLRRFTLTRRGWTNIGVVSGDDLEDAERRFFDALVRRPATPSVAPATAPASGTPATPIPRLHAPDVVGLFPEPGAQR